MKPTEFDESNLVLEAPPGVAGVEPLPAFRRLLPSAQLVTCWELEPGDFEEVMRTGRVWIVMQGATCAPMYAAAYSPFEQGWVEPDPPEGPPETITIRNPLAPIHRSTAD